MTVAEHFHPSGSALLQRTPEIHGSDQDIDPETKRIEIREYYAAVSDRYESLFQVLACDQAYYEKAIPLRHPIFSTMVIQQLFSLTN
jgi:hypothetical protein